MKKEKIETILLKIEELNPNLKTELYYETPFQLLIAVLLSAQSTDVQVNKATKTNWFFKKVKSPQDVIDLWHNQIKSYINSIGLSNSKTKNIFNLSCKILELKKPSNNKEKKILERYWYIIPSNLQGLTALPWVGVKTAKVVLSVLYEIPCVPVDTHIHRVSNRLWIVETKTELQTSNNLEKIIPQKLKNKAHHLLIFFGRYFCKAKKPECQSCPFNSGCFYFHNNEKDEKTDR